MSYRDGYDARKWFAHTAKRRPRRSWVRWAMAGGLAMLAAMPVVEMIAPGDPGRAMPDVVPFAVLLAGATACSPFMREAFLTARGFATFDEFEQAALLAALRRACLFDVIVVGTLFLWLAVAANAGWPLPVLARQWGAIGLALVTMMVVLPATFAEFMVPMPPVGDEIEEDSL